MRFIVLGKNGQEVMNLNRRKAIRERCLNCVGWIPSEVRKCDCTDCALHPYRMGTGKQDAKERAVAVQKVLSPMLPWTNRPKSVFVPAPTVHSIRIDITS